MLAHPIQRLHVPAARPNPASSGANFVQVILFSIGLQRQDLFFGSEAGQAVLACASIGESCLPS